MYSSKYVFVPEKCIDACIRADLLNNLLNRMPYEQAISIGSMQLASYWCNGHNREAIRRCEEARKLLEDYAACFGYRALQAA